jgi:hypothetical protein
MCDAYLGEVLDQFDQLNLWDDTMLIVCTDHGFLLGEHDWWAKNMHPLYNEIARTPLFIWDPRCKRQGATADGLAQLIDLSATLLEFFDAPRPADMQGIPLKDAVASNAPTRPAILFGYHGAQANVTDGRYLYMRAPVRHDNAPLHEYTLMPTHMRRPFGLDELQGITLAAPFSFTKGVQTLKIPGRVWPGLHSLETLLWDLQADPAQDQPLHDPVVEARMVQLLVQLMRENDAPPEQFVRLGLAEP